jgi:hypothetical protein
LDELDLADRTQFHRSVGAVHGPCLDENGGTYVVAAVRVGSQLVKEIALVRNALAAKIPEVMMRVADRDLGL